MYASALAGESRRIAIARDLLWSVASTSSAAVAFAHIGTFAAAAEIYEQQLNRAHEAALLYERAGQTGGAASLWLQLGDLRRARDCYIDADNRGWHR